MAHSGVENVAKSMRRTTLFDGRTTRNSAKKRTCEEIATELEDIIAHNEKVQAKAAKNAKVPDGPFRFLELPPELRNACYESIDTDAPESTYALSLESLSSDHSGERPKYESSWAVLPRPKSAPKRRSSQPYQSKRKLSSKDQYVRHHTEQRLKQLARTCRQLMQETRMYRCKVAFFAFKFEDLLRVVNTIDEDMFDDIKFCHVQTLLPSFWMHLRRICLRIDASVWERKETKPSNCVITCFEAGLFGEMFIRAADGCLTDLQIWYKSPFENLLRTPRYTDRTMEALQRHFIPGAAARHSLDIEGTFGWARVEPGGPPYFILNMHFRGTMEWPRAQRYKQFCDLHQSFSYHFQNHYENHTRLYWDEDSSLKHLIT